MKIALDKPLTNKYIIKSYSSDGIVINDAVYRNSVIVSPDRIIEDWQPRSFAELNCEHFAGIIAMAPEIVLIGTGKCLQFPDNAISASFLGKNIGVEIMDTGAACRAYNFLAGEGRLVVAALLQIET